MCGRLGALKTDVLSGRDDVMEKKMLAMEVRAAVGIPKPMQKSQAGGRRESSVVRSTNFSYTGLKFCSQQPCWAAHTVGKEGSRECGTSGLHRHLRSCACAHNQAHN